LRLSKNQAVTFAHLKYAVKLDFNDFGLLAPAPAVLDPRAPSANYEICCADT
jgi:hypothetical protein